MFSETKLRSKQQKHTGNNWQVKQLLCIFLKISHSAIMHGINLTCSIQMYNNYRLGVK